jgi:hypothetical protein
VELQVWLTKTSLEILEKLRAAGFESAADHPTGTTLVGSVKIEKLQALAQIAEVKFVSPIRK